MARIMGAWMGRFLTCFLPLAAMLLGFSLYAAVLRDPLSPRNSQIENFKYILALEKMIPGFFRQSAVFEFDLLEIVSSYIDTKGKVGSRRRRFQDLVIEPAQGASVVSYEIDPDAIQKWRDQLLQEFKKLPVDKSPRESIIARIKVLKLKLMRGGSKQILDSLMRYVPAKKRGEIGPLEFAQKKVAIRRFIPVGDILATQFFESVEGVRNAELELSRLVQAYTLVFKLDLSSARLQEKIANLNEGDIDPYVDKEHFNSVIDSLKEATQISRAVVYDLVSADIRAIVSKKIERVSQNFRKLRIVEVPPWVGIFRGCVGGDCSTANSADSALAPHERIFFIRGGDDGYKGYVQASLVKVKGRSALYISCIQGARLRTTDVLSIIYGFYLKRKDFGAEEVVLAPSDRTNDLINHVNVRSVYDSVSAEGRKVAIIFKDKAERNIIKESDSDQDHYLSHKTGMQIEFSGDKLEAINAVTDEGSFYLDISGECRREDIIPFVLSLTGDSPDDNLRGILNLIPEASRPTLSSLYAARNIIGNQDGLKLSEYEEERQKAFVSLGLSNEGSKFDYLFWAGRVRASDAFKPDTPNVDISIKAVIKMIQHELSFHTLSPGVIKNLMTSRIFKDFLIEKIQDDDISETAKIIRKLHIPADGEIGIQLSMRVQKVLSERPMNILDVALLLRTIPAEGRGSIEFVKAMKLGFKSVRQHELNALNLETEFVAIIMEAAAKSLLLIDDAVKILEVTPEVVRSRDIYIRKIGELATSPVLGFEEKTKLLETVPAYSRMGMAFAEIVPAVYGFNSSIKVRESIAFVAAVSHLSEAAIEASKVKKSATPILDLVPLDRRARVEFIEAVEKAAISSPHEAIPLLHLIDHKGRSRREFLGALKRVFKVANPESQITDDLELEVIETLGDIASRREFGAGDKTRILNLAVNHDRAEIVDVVRKVIMAGPMEQYSVQSILHVIGHRAKSSKEYVDLISDIVGREDLDPEERNFIARSVIDSSMYSEADRIRVLSKGIKRVKGVDAIHLLQLVKDDQRLHPEYIRYLREALNVRKGFSISEKHIVDEFFLSIEEASEKFEDMELPLLLLLVPRKIANDPRFLRLLHRAAWSVRHVPLTLKYVLDLDPIVNIYRKPGQYETIQCQVHLADLARRLLR